jgi:molybdopterin/thiamine biosynthesis adenylyltransferase
MIDHELILSRADLRRTAPAILLDRGRYAVAPLRGNDLEHRRELILGPWESRTTLPNGGEYPPLAEYAVLAADRAGGLTIDQLVEQIQPKRSHRIAVILLNPRDRAVFPVVLWDQGMRVPISRVRFIGTGLVTLTTEGVREQSSTLRASRTAGALRGLYPQVLALSALLVGAGRGASELARQLVAVGLRRLTVVDPDQLGLENLDAMPHVAVWQKGQSKTQVLARALRRNQPGLTISCFDRPVTSLEGLSLLDRRRFDTVFSFVDNPAARLAVSLKCRERLMVHVDVGTLIEHDAAGNRLMSVDIRLFEPGQGCSTCVPRLTPEELDDAIHQIGVPDDALYRGTRRAWNADRSGSLHHVNALACSLAAELWLGYLAGTITTSHWIRVRWPAGGVPAIEHTSIGPGDDCVVCRGAQV